MQPYTRLLDLVDETENVNGTRFIESIESEKPESVSEGYLLDFINDLVLDGIIDGDEIDQLTRAGHQMIDSSSTCPLDHFTDEEDDEDVYILDLSDVDDDDEDDEDEE